MARILLVDDDGLVLRGAQRILQRAGHEVWESSSPKTALHMLATVNPDVVITDVYMPGMNGVELVRRITECEGCRRIIAMTGGGVLNTASEMLAQARTAGAGRTIAKPFMPGELEAAVADVLASLPLDAAAN
jgi:CheY-like chemotaxis protein